jgi:UDPglucose--hexose-1-phosphate uridylyltransferase
MRVVPNRYPLTGVAAGMSTVSARESPPPTGADALRSGLAVGGAHEVIVFSTDHHRSLGSLDAEEIGVLLDVARRRIAHHGRQGLVSQFFVNHGSDAGASLTHPHGQLVALPEVLPEVKAEAEAFAAVHCILCAEMAHPGHPELVVTGGHVEAWCPWWSRVPFELLVAPRGHQTRLQHVGWEELIAVGATIRDALRRLADVRHDPPYRLALHEAPPGEVAYHWHVHLWPVAEREGGLEWAGGIAVNSTPPAVAAGRLRACDRSAAGA